MSSSRVPFRRLAVAALAAASAFLLPGFANAATTAPPPPPSYAGNLPDPSIIVSGGQYYGYGTQEGGGSYGPDKPSYIQTVHGSGLTSWQAPPSQEALGQLPTWAVPGWTWAPEVIRLPTGQTGQTQYVMYYGARHCGATATPCPSGSGITANNHLCIAVATSATPAGPFTTSSRPLICSSSQDSIDPSPLLDSSGKLYLYWKSNALFYGATIYGQQLSSTGLALTGSSVALLHKNSSWQGNNIEAPAMVPNGTGRYDLFYSGNNYATRNYAIGYAECSGPLSSCTNTSTGAAWFSTPTPSGSPSSTTACYPNDATGSPTGPNGPGGQSFLRDDSGHLVSPVTGQRVMAYHGWGGTIGPAPRFMWVATVTWSSGRPVRPDSSWMGTPCST